MDILTENHRHRAGPTTMSHWLLNQMIWICFIINIGAPYGEQIVNFGKWYFNLRSETMLVEDAMDWFCSVL